MCCIMSFPHHSIMLTWMLFRTGLCPYINVLLYASLYSTELNDRLLPYRILMHSKKPCCWNEHTAWGLSIQHSCLRSCQFLYYFMLPSAKAKAQTRLSQNHGNERKSQLGSYSTGTEDYRLPEALRKDKEIPPVSMVLHLQISSLKGTSKHD